MAEQWWGQVRWFAEAYCARCGAMVVVRHPVAAALRGEGWSRRHYRGWVCRACLERRGDAGG